MLFVAKSARVGDVRTVRSRIASGAFLGPDYTLIVLCVRFDDLVGPPSIDDLPLRPLIPHSRMEIEQGRVAPNSKDRSSGRTDGQDRLKDISIAI